MKTPVLEPVFNKVAGFQACNLLKTDTSTGLFLVNIAKFLRTGFLQCFCLEPCEISMMEHFREKSLRL